MRNHSRVRSGLLSGWPGLLVAAAVAVLASGSATLAQKLSIEELLSGVVRLKTHINPNGRTVENLGRDREGSGIVIDENGLILTIGYLMVEAHAAEVITNDGRTVPANVVGYDNETGLGLLQAISPLRVRPLPFGKSSDVKERDPVIVAAFGGPTKASAALVASKRQFAGNWEYLIDDAIFTSPPHPSWSGAALINREGKLIGVGHLIVGDANGKGENNPGNMFVPIDRLPPILGDLMADGRVSGPIHPWIGLTTNEAHGRLFVASVTKDGPAERAGVRRGDIIIAVAGAETKTLADLYRKIWAQGAAGATIPLDLLQGSEKVRIEVKSINRLDHLRLKTTF